MVRCVLHILWQLVRVFVGDSKSLPSFCFTFHDREVGMFEGLPGHSFTLLRDL